MNKKKNDGPKKKDAEQALALIHDAAVERRLRILEAEKLPLCRLIDAVGAHNDKEMRGALEGYLAYLDAKRESDRMFLGDMTFTESLMVELRYKNQLKGHRVLEASLATYVQRVIKDAYDRLNDDEARLFGYLIARNDKGKLLSYAKIGKLLKVSHTEVMNRRNKLYRDHPAVVKEIEKHGLRKSRGKRNG